MNIAGIGIVSTCGRGADRYEEALKQGWVMPPQKEAPFLPGKRMPVYFVEQEAITDKTVFKRMRRADRFSKMAVLAAWDAMEDCGISIEPRKESLGIIVATAFGPQVTAFKFLDDIIDYGDASVSPTIFSHSVHNAAASYIASAIGSRGPTLTVTRFAFSFHQAVIIAQAWLQERRCDNVLVGSVDECGTVMEYVFSQKLKIAEDGKIKPFEFSRKPVAIAGEGSVFFLLTRESSPKKYCEISGVFFNKDREEVSDMYLLDADGMAGDESCYKKISSSDAVIAGYSPLFGSMMTGSAYHCASAALMLKNQIQYASPVQVNPYDVEICKETKHAELNSICCVRYACGYEKAEIQLRRKT